MNERIRELAEQATIITSYQYQTWEDRTAIDYKGQFDKEKFAELIVRECAVVAIDHMELNEGTDYGIGRRIKEHFGVEE